jgi:hypothetical protein
MMQDTGFMALTVTNTVAALIIFFGALSDRMRLYPKWHKAGLILAAAGLAAQAVRNVQFLATGVSPSDADLPLWVLKDLGICIIAFFYLAHGLQSHFAPKATPAALVRKRTVTSNTNSKRAKGAR